MFGWTSIAIVRDATELHYVRLNCETFFLFVCLFRHSAVTLWIIARVFPNIQMVIFNWTHSTFEMFIHFILFLCIHFAPVFSTVICWFHFNLFNMFSSEWITFASHLAVFVLVLLFWLSNRDIVLYWSQNIRFTVRNRQAFLSDSKCNSNRNHQTCIRIDRADRNRQKTPPRWIVIGF